MPSRIHFSLGNTVISKGETDFIRAFLRMNQSLKGIKLMPASQKAHLSTILSLGILFSNDAIAGEKLNKIFNADTIGANVPYLERITGPARNTLNLKAKVKLNTYKVDGCEVTVRIANDTVQSLGIEQLSQKCTFNLNNFLPNVGRGKLPPLHSMTFGQFDALTGDGKYTASCLMSCGNAADPMVYESWQAPRSDGGFELQLGVVLVSGPALDASSKWESAMVKTEGEKWVIDTKFNCSNKYNSIAQKAFRNVKITSATIGYGFTANDCGR